MTARRTFEYVTKFLKKYALLIIVIFFIFLSVLSSKMTEKEIINSNRKYAKKYTIAPNKISSEFPDSDGDGRSDNDDPFPDEFNVFYDRQAVREYAAANANNTGDTDIYPYLSGGITDCANFVSQCIRAGGYEMNDKWYMYRYSDNVSWVRKKSEEFSGKLDKVIVMAENSIINRIAGIMGKNGEIPVTDTAFTIGRLYSDGASCVEIEKIEPKNVDGDFKWSNSWSSAEWQISYGKEHFFSDSKSIEIPVASKDDIKKNVDNVVDYILKNDMQIGDLVYLGIKKTIFHVMIITNITDDGKVYLSGHTVEKNEALFDEKLWQAERFSDVTLYKVNDVIK